jgi:hypothetical protein
MAGRGLGIWIAVFYVLPLILAVEGALQPRAAWKRVGQPRLVWLAAFVGGPVLTMATGWWPPAAVSAAASAVFMAKPRSTLLVAAGLERERRRQQPPGAEAE